MRAKGSWNLLKKRFTIKDKNCSKTNKKHRMQVIS